MPYCANCGTEARDEQRFCAVCGTPRGVAASVTPMPALSDSSYGDDAQVRVGLSMDPPRQSRWSIAFRAVLVLPLYLLLLIVTVVAEFAVLFSWISALFTGRVPTGLQNFLTDVARFQSNVLAYSFLLVSRWPGAAFNEKSSDQVTIGIDHVRLRRSSVFFRIFLSVPAALVGEVVNLGVFPLLFVMWVWGLVTGREPRVLHQCAALILRYQLRMAAYVYLLTPTQPFRGFFGDGVESRAGSTANDAPPPVTSTADSPARPTHWLVAKATRTLFVVVLVLSVPLFIASLFAEAPLFAHFKVYFARAVVSSSYDNAIDALGTFDATVAACPSSEKQSCVSSAAGSAYSSLSSQSALLANNAFIPTDALGAATKYESALRRVEHILYVAQYTLSSSTQNAAVFDQLPPATVQVRRDYAALKTVLDR